MPSPSFAFILLREEGQKIPPKNSQSEKWTGDRNIEKLPAAIRNVRFRSEAVTREGPPFAPKAQRPSAPVSFPAVVPRGAVIAFLGPARALEPDFCRHIHGRNHPFFASFIFHGKPVEGGWP